MIGTLAIKQQQLAKGFFTTGSGSEVILVMGSCRVVNYVTYLDEWNKQKGNRFTIHSIDPFNWNWNEKDERVDYAEVLRGLETSEPLLSMLTSVNIFIHEYYQNAGMFNVFKHDGKTIYNFGMNPQIDVCLPNWNDIFVLFADIVSFDLEMRKKAIQDYNVLGKLAPETEKEIFTISQRNLYKFYEVCFKSDLPEMHLWFKQNMKTKRPFWTYNHTSKWFTIAVWRLLNEKFLHLDLSGFDENHEDIFANNFTRLTEYDQKWYGFDWGEDLGVLRDKL